MITEETIQGSIEALQQIFRDVAPLILQSAGKTESSDKSDGSVVTEVDVIVERQIIEYLQARFPNLPVFGEESGYISENLPDPCLLIDPIDGTSSFVINNPAFTSMALLICGGKAEAAVIYNPSSDDMYVARAGKGAYKNGRQLDIRSMPLSETVFCKQTIAPMIEKILATKNIRATKTAGVAGHEFNQVADGSVAARFQLYARGHLHDYAPGALLVKEAGGDIIPVLDDTYTMRTRSFVACHPELSELIRSNLAAIRELEDPDTEPL